MMKHEYNTSKTTHSAVPVTDIHENTDGYTMKMEMPGVSRENLSITLEKNELEIRGSANSKVGDDYQHLYAEYALDNFHRKFRVGNDIDSDRIEAKLENGVLTMTLHKREERKPRKIEVLAH